MNENFNKLSESKKNTVINAALMVFSKYGYKKATADEIVKEAEISKGILFHYFGSKKGLYLYLIDYAVTVLTKSMGERDYGNGDFFEVLMRSAKKKFEIMDAFPYLFDFMIASYLDNYGGQAGQRSQKDKDALKVMRAELLEKCDATKFKDPADMEKLLDLLIWASEGFSKELLQKKSKQERKELIDRYIQSILRLKDQFYKEEYL